MKERLSRLRRSRSVENPIRENSNPGMHRVRSASPFQFIRKRPTGFKRPPHSSRNTKSSRQLEQNSVESEISRHQTGSSSHKRQTLIDRQTRSNLTVKIFVIPYMHTDTHTVISETRNLSDEFGKEDFCFPAIECVIVNDEQEKKIHCNIEAQMDHTSIEIDIASISTADNIDPNSSNLQELENHITSPQNSIQNSSEKKQVSFDYCNYCQKNIFSPSLPPEKWPQRPLFLRPTPGSNTRVLGIRFASSKQNDYFSTPWPQALKKHWNKNKEETDNYSDETIEKPPCCNKDRYDCPLCQFLPINNGTEKKGESLVTDFESDLFKGTLLIRIKDSKGTSQETDVKVYSQNDNDSKDSVHKSSQSYFHGVNRSYQVVIQGHFKPSKSNSHNRIKSIPILECVTGQAGFHRPSGYLPPRFIRNTAVRILSIFAPRLQAKFDGIPKFLSPLSSTPQVVIVKKESYHKQSKEMCETNIEGDLEEPSICSNSLLNSIPINHSNTNTFYKTSTAPLSMTRAKYRKKIFDKIYDSKSICPLFECYETDDKINNNKEDDGADHKIEYTFEFLQHLVNFQTFQIDLGHVGKLSLNRILDGQPLKVMAAHQVDLESNEKYTKRDVLKWLWSFDIWHESLYEAALKHEDRIYDTR